MSLKCAVYLGLGVMGLAAGASAATLVGTPMNPTGIQGLIVDGIAYDVTFSTKSYDALFTGTAPQPIFDSDPAAGFDAEGPLNEFFRSAGVTGLNGVPCALRTAPCYVLIPNSTLNDQGTVVAWGGEVIWSDTYGWFNGAGTPGLALNAPAGNCCGHYVEYAVFRPAAAHLVKFNIVTLTPPDGTETTAFDLNDSDQAIGAAYGGSIDESVLWNETTPTPIATPPGQTVLSLVSINGSGVAVGGSCFVGNCVPTGWSAAVGTFRLPSVWGFVTGISDTGAMVGYATGAGTSPNGPFFAVEWSGPAATTWTPLPVVGGTRNVSSAAYSINAAGQIVGLSNFSDSTEHATYWYGTEARDLGTLGGASSRANKISDGGLIVGWANLKNGLQHAALWRPTTVAYDLGTLGGAESLAWGVNEEGDVVGAAQTKTGAWHAVLWTHKHYVAIDLDAEIGAAAASSVTLIEAFATNGRCRVLANGPDNVTHKGRTFLLTLTDQTDCNQP